MEPGISSKRFYTFPEFQMAVQDLLEHLGDLRSAVRNRGVPRSFAEKIMLAVTRVNRCRYCSFAHSRAALAAGIPENELRDLLVGDYSDIPEHELVAVTFAQHWAESRSQPEPEATRRLSDYYGAQTSQDILAFIRAITFGNLYGNTFDVLLSRMAGRPVSGSTLWGEISVILGVFLMLPAGLFLRPLARRLSRPAAVQ